MNKKDVELFNGYKTVREEEIWNLLKRKDKITVDILNIVITLLDDYIHSSQLEKNDIDVERAIRKLEILKIILNESGEYKLKN